MTRLAQFIGGVVLLALGMSAPQYVYFVSGNSRVLALLTGLVIAGLWSALMLFAGATLRAGAVAACIGLALIIFTPVAGMAEMQQALQLAHGKSLDDVPLARVLTDGEENMWVRINDARVRSEISKRLEFVSGATSSKPGQPANPTRSHIEVSPLTLATEVSAEEPMYRSKPSGVVAVWACAPDSARLTQWDRERQAVRGRLARMEEHVERALNRELAPSGPTLLPGAFAIPAAPGAEPSAPPLAAPPAVLRAASPSWCVHLEPTLNAAAAKQQAFDSLLVFLIMLPLMGAGLCLAIARIK